MDFYQKKIQSHFERNEASPSAIIIAAAAALNPISPTSFESNHEILNKFSNPIIRCSRSLFIVWRTNAVEGMQL
jgi:hypothetical protein